MHDTASIEIITSWLGSGSINIFGRPFAGKDSQGKRLAELFDGHLIGGGEILRNSIIPDDIRLMMRRGLLVTSRHYVNIVLPYLNQPYLKNKPLILSSVGRWDGEQQGVIDAVKAADHPLKAVIYLRLEEKDVLNRWQDEQKRHDRSHRHDDSEETLYARFAEFRLKTQPVIDYYREQNLLIEIDGTLSRDEVTDVIINHLRQRALGQ